MRFSEIVKIMVRFGAVFGYRNTYGAVRCGRPAEVQPRPGARVVSAVES